MLVYQDEDKSKIDYVRKLLQFRSNANANGITVSLPPGLRGQTCTVNTAFEVPPADPKCLINHARELVVGAPEIQRRVEPKYLQTSATAETSMADVMSGPVHGNYLGGWLQYPTQNACGPKKIDKNVPQPIKAKAYKHKIGYLSLPGEIRNRIMWFALVPGEVFPSHKTQPRNQRGSRKYMPGCQLLATCRQVYLEGYESFYSLNAFHLPRGPLSASIKYFGSLKPEHQCLISRFCIDFSILDLTPSVITSIEEVLLGSKVCYTEMPSANREIGVVTRCILNALRDLWIEKIIAVGKTFGIKCVELRRIPVVLHDLFGAHMPYTIARKALIMEGPGIASRLNPLDLVMSRNGWDSLYFVQDSRCRWDDKILWLLEEMLMDVELIITATLIHHEADKDGGWEQFKHWLRHIDNSASEECTCSQVDEEFWNEEKGWHAGHRSRGPMPFAN